MTTVSDTPEGVAAPFVCAISCPAARRLLVFTPPGRFHSNSQDGALGARRIRARKLWSMSISFAQRMYPISNNGFSRAAYPPEIGEQN